MRRPAAAKRPATSGFIPKPTPPGQTPSSKLGQISVLRACAKLGDSEDENNDGRRKEYWREDAWHGGYWGEDWGTQAGEHSEAPRKKRRKSRKLTKLRAAKPTDGDVRKMLLEKAWQEMASEEQDKVLKMLGKPSAEDYRKFHAALKPGAETGEAPAGFKAEYEAVMALKGQRGKSVGRTAKLSQLCNSWRVARLAAKPGENVWDTASVSSKWSKEKKQGSSSWTGLATAGCLLC